MKILKPNLVVNSLSELNLQLLWESGKRGIILDLDNTITLWNERELNEVARTFLLEAQNLKYQILLLTNAKEKRTKEIANQYGLLYIAPALKPRKSAFLKALRIMNLSAEQVIVIGDQIFTDVLGGNRVGCFTVLVPPLSKREFLGTKILRFLESLVKNGVINKQ